MSPEGIYQPHDKMIGEGAAVEDYNLKAGIYIVPPVRGVTRMITFGPDRNTDRPVVIIRTEVGGLYAVQERLTPQSAANMERTAFSSQEVR